MLPWINYHHLYYFKIIAEEGSVSKAAEKLRLGQPTLSAQLRQFEDTLGIQLFERHHKKLTLTEQGKVALDYSKSIFKLGSEMYEVLNDRIRPSRPTLHIGALDSIPKQIILQIVQSAFKISPCQITLSEGKHDELIRDLTSHKIDILIMNFIPSGAGAKNLFPRRIAKNEIAFYGAPSFKSLRKNFPQSISGAPLIVPTYDSKLRFDLDHWAKILKLELNIVIESQDICMKKLLAVNGIGLIPTAPHTVARQIKQGEFIEIGKTKGIYEELILLTASRKIENQIAATLAESFSV